MSSSRSSNITGCGGGGNSRADYFKVLNTLPFVRFC